MIINCKKLLSITTGCFLALSIFADSAPEVIEDENGDPIGIKLNLPEELINDCKDDFWTLKDEETKTELDKFLSSQESFDEWCEAQSPIDNKNPVIVRNALRKYAYFLLDFMQKSDKKFEVPLPLFHLRLSHHQKVM